MAGPGSPRQLPTPCTSAILVNKSSSKPSLRTYSKRTLQDISKPPSKRQRIELAKIPVKSTTKSGVQPSTPNIPKKRSISEYFEAVTHTRTSSSPHSSIFSSDPVQKNFESSPSSPPSPYTSPSVAPPKKRPRRRLTARAPLALIKMSDINAGGSKEHRKGKGKTVGIDKGPFYPGSPSRTPYLTKTSPPGLRQAARGGTSSEEDEEESDGEANLRLDGDIPRSDPIDIPGARIRSAEELVIPFAPQRPYVFCGQALQPSNSTHPNRLLTFGSADTLVEGSTAGSRMTLGSADTLVTGASARPHMTPSPQSIEDRARTEMLLATQPTDPDMVFALSADHLDHGVPGPGIPYPGTSTIHSTENRSRIPANLTNAGPSTQSNVVVPPIAQAPANSAAVGVIQPNIPAPSNAAQGSANLIQKQLDLGRPAVITCNICRFTFNRTLLGDVRAHTDYHDTHIFGEPVIGLTTNHRYHLQSIDTGIGQGDYVVMVDRSSTEGWKNLALSVLERHVDKELGSVPISANILWSSIADPAATESTSGATQVDRFKVYMYVRRYVPKMGRVVSILLAERISTGFETNRIQVEADEFGPWPPIVRKLETVVSTKAHEAVLGVNKFWTIRRSRRSGYGKTLLDQARQTFVPSYIIPRVHIAWTCTTDDGARFAKEYLQCQADYDFLTYDDQM